MSQSLVPCPSCNRHVFGDARACPFCSARLEPREAPRVSESPVPHLSRAALLAAGAALACAVACDRSVAPPYGTWPGEDASYDSPADRGSTDTDGGAGGHGGAGGASPSHDAGTRRLVAPPDDVAAPVPRKRAP